MLDAKNITKIYHSEFESRLVLNHVNLHIEKTEMVGIMGVSGAGKTTLLKILGGLEQAYSGEVCYAKDNISSMDEEQLNAFRAAKIGFVFQDFHLIRTLNVFDNIALALSITSNLKFSEIEERVHMIAKQLQIDSILKKDIREISGGEAQRCACARAMIKKPEIILADEPTGALDSKSSMHLLEALVSMNQTLKTTILIVTHNPQIASYLDRVIFLQDGKVMNQLQKQADPNQVFLNKILDVLYMKNAI